MRLMAREGGGGGAGGKNKKMLHEMSGFRGSGLLQHVYPSRPLCMCVLSQPWLI